MVLFDIRTVGNVHVPVKMLGHSGVGKTTTITTHIKGYKLDETDVVVPHTPPEGQKEVWNAKIPCYETKSGWRGLVNVDFTDHCGQQHKQKTGATGAKKKGVQPSLLSSSTADLDVPFCLYYVGDNREYTWDGLRTILNEQLTATKHQLITAKEVPMADKIQIPVVCVANKLDEENRLNKRRISEPYDMGIDFFWTSAHELKAVRYGCFDAGFHCPKDEDKEKTRAENFVRPAEGADFKDPLQYLLRKYFECDTLYIVPLLTDKPVPKKKKRGAAAKEDGKVAAKKAKK